MKIRYLVWSEVLVLLALVVAIALGVLWRIRRDEQTWSLESGAMQVVNQALELNVMAYEGHQMSVHWPRDQWLRKLDQLESTLKRPEMRALGDPDLLRSLDQDARDLRRLVEAAAPSGVAAPPGVTPIWRDGLVNTLFKLTGNLANDGLRLVDASHQHFQDRERSINWGLGGGVAMLGLGWVLLTGRFSRAIVKSLTKLGGEAEAMAQQGPKCRLAEDGPEEVKALARSFNTLCDRLQQAHQELRRQLEERGREAALREAALAEISAERGLFLGIVNLAPAGLAFFEDAELRLKWANAVFLSFLDEPNHVAGVCGLRLEDFMPELAGTPLPLIFQRVRQTRQAYASETEFEFAGLQREATFWQWKVLPLGAEELPPDLLLILIDVTEQTLARKRLEELAARLEQMNQAKDNFMAILGHELRNPLAPIQNSLYVLKQRGFENDVQSHSFSIIERQVRHMNRLVDDLLDVSRISRGKIELRRARVELEKILRQAVESTNALIQSRGHELTVRLPETPVVLDADPARLEQILVNLLNNAAKYTEPGGRIWLEVEHAEGEAVIRVRDTGVGIAPEMISRIFEPFSQVSHSLDLSQGGLGLGLALVRSLTQLHGGSVELHSAGLGQGSEFTVRLPALPEGSGLAYRPRTTQNAQEFGLRILIVEDNADTSGSMAELLAMWGHESAVASDGPSAVARALEYQPDLVLLDIGLPGMDGYQVARKLREQPGLSTAPILAVSGYGQTEDLDRSREAGIQHHLTKPIDLGRLHGLLASYARGESLETST